MNTILWLIACIILLIVEAATLNLTTIWFAVGSLTAYLLALLGVGFLPQFAAFTAVSLLLLAFTRPLVQKYVNNHTVKTNVDNLVGQHAKVTCEINNPQGYGAAMVNGLEWTAVSIRDDVIIREGEIGIITAVSGVKLILARPEDTLHT